MTWPAFKSTFTKSLLTKSSGTNKNLRRRSSLYSNVYFSSRYSKWQGSRTLDGNRYTTRMFNNAKDAAIALNMILNEANLPLPNPKLGISGSKETEEESDNSEGESGEDEEEESYESAEEESHEMSRDEDSRESRRKKTANSKKKLTKPKMKRVPKKKASPKKKWVKKEPVRKAQKIRAKKKEVKVKQEKVDVRKEYISKSEKVTMSDYIKADEATPMFVGFIKEDGNWNVYWRERGQAKHTAVLFASAPTQVELQYKVFEKLDEEGKSGRRNHYCIGNPLQSWHFSDPGVIVISDDEKEEETKFVENSEELEVNESDSGASESNFE